MKNEYATVIHRWVDELWNKGNENIINELLAPDCRAHGLAEEPIIGPEAFKPFYRTFSTALSGTVMTIEDVIVQENKIAARCRVQAKHTGNSFGFAYR